MIQISFEKVTKIIIVFACCLDLLFGMLFFVMFGLVGAKRFLFLVVTVTVAMVDLPVRF